MTLPFLYQLEYFKEKNVSVEIKITIPILQAIKMLKFFSIFGDLFYQYKVKISSLKLKKANLKN